jgi:hypothetical protein
MEMPNYLGVISKVWRGRLCATIGKCRLGVGCALTGERENKSLVRDIEWKIKRVRANAS